MHDDKCVICCWAPQGSDKMARRSMHHVACQSGSSLAPESMLKPVDFGLETEMKTTVNQTRSSRGRSVCTSAMHLRGEEILKLLK